VPWWTGREKSASAFIPCEIPEQTSHAVTELARSLGVQEKSVWCSAYLALLSLLSGTDTVVGTSITQGRPEIPGGDKIIGVFLNALPIRRRTSGRRWVDLITATDQELRQQHAFRHYPLVEIQRLTGLDLSATTFHYSNWHVYYEGVDREGTREEWIPQKVGGWQETNYLLSFYVHKDDRTQRHDVSILADTEVFDAAFRERISGYVARIVAAIVRDSTGVIEKTALLSDEERHRQWVEWNAPARAYSRSKCIHELFEEQARARAGEVAVTDGDRSLTYEELDRRANLLSCYLVAQGVGPEVAVGICTERSLEMVVGLLAILKAGGCYVPLDPDYPAERIAHLLSTSACRLVLCELDLLQTLPASDAVKTFPLSGELHDKLLAPYSTEKISADIRPSQCNSAYVIFTSGSTGKPKGVRISHASLSNYLGYASEAYFSRRAGAVVSTSLSFDATVTSLLVPLVAGKFTYLLRQNGDEFERLKQIMIAPGADLVFKLTPAHMEMLESLIDAAVDNEHLLVIGETVVGCSTHWVAERLWSADESGAVPIGRPISQTSLYVVDEDLQGVPMGVPGELLIGGAGVAQGYVNQPAQTAERFIPNPFGGTAGERLYKTGDIVRWLDSGDLEYIGRADTQIKIRGFRIELGEIEGAMLRHARVKDAVAVGKRDDSGNDRVVVYVVEEGNLGGDQVANSLTNELRAHAQDLLPAYMQPSAIVVMDALPITSNGKRNLEALPQPDFARFQAAFVAPRNEVERSLCGYWQDLLKIETIGIHDDFWMLGGQSLLAMRVCNFVRQAFAVELKLSRMFSHPSVAQLAEHISLELDARNLSSTRLVSEITEDVEEGSF
jgi:non-ribosomal peptide synthetase component F